jgi:Peptidase family M48
MHISVYLTLAFSALFGASASFARRLPPALATCALSAGGLLVAAASTAALGFLGLTALGQVPLLARLGRWSTPELTRHNPVPTSLACIALLLLTFLAVRVTRALLAAASALLESHRVAAGLAAHSGELVVIDRPEPAAYAVPGHPGRIVISTGLLRRLNAGERRAVLSHERAHLTQHHHLHHTAAALAAAANPFLVRLPALVAASCERWADESAGRDVPRVVVADALTSAGTGALRPSNMAVLAGVVDVADRVLALQRPTPRVARWRVMALASLLGVVALTTLDAGYDVNGLFEGAQNAYHCVGPSCS